MNIVNRIVLLLLAAGCSERDLFKARSRRPLGRARIRPLALGSVPPAILAATLLVLVEPSGGLVLAQQPESGIREEVIAELSSDVRQNDLELVASSDGKQLAWREKRRGKYVVLLNGKPAGGLYDEVAGLHFSRDGKRSAFAARKGKDYTTVIDGAGQGGPYREVGSTIFSPDSSRFAFPAKVKDGYFWVVDGKPGTLCKDVLPAEFSSDSRHLAYGAQRGKERVIVADGVESPPYDIAGHPLYTPEGHRLVYVAKRGKANLLVDDGKERPLSAAEDGYELLGFVPGTEEPILARYNGNLSRMMVGKVEGPLAAIRLEPVQCSEGCQHSVYATARIVNPALAAERAYGQVVIDGKGGREYEGAPVESAARTWLRAAGGQVATLKPGAFPQFTTRWHGVSTPTVTKNFEHVAYAARRGNKDLTVVVDGEEGPRMDAIPCEPKYSPEGKLFYVGVADGKVTLIVDGKKTSEMSLSTGEWDEKEGACAGPDFADGGHYVYIAVQPDGTRIVADGSEFKLRPMPEVVGPQMQVTGDRFHFAYAVRPDLAKPESLLIVDGKESQAYDDIWPYTVRWSGDGILTYVARRGQKLLRVTQTVP